MPVVKPFICVYLRLSVDSFQFISTLSLVLISLGCSIDSPGPSVTGMDDRENAPVLNPGPSSASITRAQLAVRTLAGGFDTPWDLALDPQGNLWVTERFGAVSMVDTATGRARRLGVIEDVFERSESGLMGMAFHPDFPVQPYIYFVHSYQRGDIRNRLIRMRFDGGQLRDREILLDNIPGSFNHNGSRLTIGPDRLLYMTTGDAEGPNFAVELTSLAGKILRVTLDGGVPPKNPFRNAIYSLGHRNPQGLVFHPITGALYATEHGPRTNDEVNRIAMGRHHGWPEVHGYCHDEDVPGLAEAQYCRENNVVEPVAAWTPTIAPAGADFYLSDAIPLWQGSLLFTTLKGQALHRLTLSADGARAVSDEVFFYREFGRLRDVVVGARGEIYLATSNRDGRGEISGEDRIIRIQVR